MPLTAYPGTDPLTNGSAPTNGTFLFPYPSGFGIFPTPLEATDGDDRSAGNLMLGLESVTDRTNYLGWRMIDWISGGTYTWTASVSLANDMTWVAVSNFTTTSQVNLEGATYVTGGSTGVFNIGNPILGSGVMRVRGNGIVTFDATSTIQGAPKFITKALFAPGTPLAPGIEVSSGAIVFTGTQPAPTAAPASIGMLYGTQLTSAWVAGGFNGTTTPTLSDGFNVAGFTLLNKLGGAGFDTLQVNFATSLTTTHPSVHVTALGPEDGGTPIIPTCVKRGTGSVELQFYTIGTGSSFDLRAAQLDISGFSFSITVTGM